MGLTRYLIRRLVFLVFTLIGVSLMVFILSHMVPADPVAANLSQANLNNPELIAAFKAKWGLDQPLYVQYFTYIKNFLHGDMGTSIRTKRDVLVDLKQYFPATIELSIFSIIIAVVLGILFGIVSAIKRNSFIDQILRAVSVLGVSLPQFWFGLAMLYVFYYKLGWLPGPGRIGAGFATPTGGTGFFLIDAMKMKDWALFKDVLRHLLLPAIVLGAFTMGLITRTTRAGLLEVMSMDYIRTARAKGLKEKAVIMKHALGNALIPVITVIGLGFGNLLGGTVVIETIFGWPGVGQYAYKSATFLDFPAIIGVSLLIAAIYIVINLITDLLYGILDPRVRYE